MTRKQAVEGLKDLEKALGELTKSTQRGVISRTLKKAMRPIVETAQENAPEASGALKKGFVITTRRPKGEKSSGQQAFGRAKSLGLSTALAREYARAAGSGPVVVYGGPGKNAAAGQQEWGNSRHRPQPYMRPAWDGEADGALDSIRRDLAAEIKKSVARARARALKKSRG